MCKDPVVVAAFISVGGIVITVIANLLFDFFRVKNASEEKFFYESYHRRLALYEDVIKELQSMQTFDLNKIKDITGIEASGMIIDRLHTLNTLTVRLRLFGSEPLVDLLVKLSDNLISLQTISLKDPLSIASEVITSIASSAEITLKAFVIAASENTSNAADKTINKFLKRFVKSKKKK